MRSQGRPSSTLFCRLHEYFVEWVSCGLFLFKAPGYDRSFSGCHALALALVRTWRFERFTVLPKDKVINEVEDFINPLPATRPSFGLVKHGRRASILIDMDVPSDPSTRAASPVHKPTAEKDESEFQPQGKPPPKKTGLGSLMKSAKQDVNVPEFDMNAFF